MRKDDLWVLQGDGEARPYLQTEFKERAGHLSPDERWMVYVSDEAGRDAIYIRPFPTVNGGKWRVSGGAGGARRGGEPMERKFSTLTVAVSSSPSL